MTQPRIDSIESQKLFLFFIKIYKQCMYMNMNSMGQPRVFGRFFRSAMWVISLFTKADCSVALAGYSCTTIKNAERGQPFMPHVTRSCPMVSLLSNLRSAAILPIFIKEFLSERELTCLLRYQAFAKIPSQDCQ